MGGNHNFHKCTTFPEKNVKLSLSFNPQKWVIGTKNGLFCCYKHIFTVTEAFHVILCRYEWDKLQLAPKQLFLHHKYFDYPPSWQQKSSILAEKNCS